jgi:hypothetical protein
MRRLCGRLRGRPDSAGSGLHPAGQACRAQAALEADYRRELAARFGLSFTRLYTITNMAIGRFATQLKHEGKADAYRELLEGSFNAATVAPLMCRHQIDVDWNGTIYDCDFNLALKLPVGNGRRSIRISTRLPRKSSPATAASVARRGRLVVRRVVDLTEPGGRSMWAQGRSSSFTS